MIETTIRQMMFRCKNRLIYKSLLWLLRIITSMIHGRFYVERMNDEIWDRLRYVGTGVYVDAAKNVYINRRKSLLNAEKYFGQRKIEHFVYKHQDGYCALLTTEGLLMKNRPFTKRGLYRILVPNTVEGGYYAPYYGEENKRIKKEREELRKEILSRNGCVIHENWVEYPKKKK